ncbi:MAG: hypothetical protein J0L78_13090 [Planctomycetes bacterium]|nr:hypothetical protein [Planctomycetota bacterium]
MNFRQGLGAAAVVGVLTLVPVTGLAQSSSVAPQSAATLAAQRQALSLMMKPMSVDYQQVRLEAVIKNIADVTGAPFVVLWQDDRNQLGLDKEAIITFGAVDQTALTVLEGALAQAGSATTGGGATWQMTEGGMIEIGPKERLNRTRRLEIYDISDLLLEIQDYNSVPQFDLNSALQSASSGGGGGSSPFSGGNQQNTLATGKTVQERADEVIRLVTEIVEPDQWTNNGGAAATVRFYKQQLLVTAPDYIQRQINGYPFWPSEQTNITQGKNSRSVTFLPGRSSRVVQTASVPSAPAASATSNANPNANPSTNATRPVTAPASTDTK